jgi:hypothetical protein
MRDRRAAAAPVVALLALAGCGGDERQDAGAPSGEFALEVTRASFPARQTLAEPATLRLDVRNPGTRAVPDLAVVVATEPKRAGTAATAFGTTAAGDGLADARRPVWVLDEGPEGGRTAYGDTWAFGRLARGAVRSVRFAVTAARPGRYRVTWRVAPALEGSARLESRGRTQGAFRVTISDAPVRSRVGRDGRVVRGDGD